MLALSRSRSSLAGRLVLAAALLGSSAAAAGEISATASLMSFNIRYGLADDGENRWELRRELVFETLRGDSYDFIGLQEALPFQIEEIAEALPGYGLTYRTRQVDPKEGEACAIFYREDRWELDRRNHGTFWLSETPDEAGSKSWDSSLPRIATWGRFEDRESGVAVWVFNTHFDHRGQKARENSASLLRARALELSAGAPLLVMGDFNAGESNPAIARLRGGADSGARWVDSFRVVRPRDPEPYTGNGWGERTTGQKIDAIFVPEGTVVKAAAVERPRFDGRTPSDHDPVTATVALRVSFDELSVEITDLGACRGCAASIARAIAKLEGVLSAELHESEPRLLVAVAEGSTLDPEVLRQAVRDVGYTAGEIRSLSSPR